MAAKGTRHAEGALSVVICNGDGNQRLIPDSGIAGCFIRNYDCSFIETSFNNLKFCL